LKQVKFLFLTFILLFSIAIPCISSEWSDYRPSTLQQVLAQHRSDIAALDYYYEPRTSVLITVTYMGKMRPITDRHRDFISRWLKTYGNKPEYASLYTHEILVMESSSSYWLPIQKNLLKPLITEIKKSESVSLFVLFTGSVKKEPVLLINEFKKTRP
jgi:hypothetical protein